MDEILQAVLDDAPGETLAGLEMPESYRAAFVRRDEAGMFEGMESAEKDPRKSLHVGEVALPELAPDEAYVAVMASAINFNTVWTSIFEPLPTFGFLDIHVRDVCGHAPDVDVIHGLRPEAGLPVGADLQADGLRQSHAVVQSLEVVPSDVAIAAHGFEEILLIGDDGEAHHEKDIGPEIGDTILNVVVRTGDHRDHKDQDRYREGHAQQG